MVPANLQALLVESANCSMAYNTWRQHKTVLNLISKCQQQTGVSMSLPWSQACYATFVAGCMKKENRSSSITVIIIYFQRPGQPRTQQPWQPRPQRQSPEPGTRT